MAADRARDLTFSILSDTDKLNLESPAQDLDNLAASATDAGKALDTLDQADGRGLDRVGQAADDARTDLERLGQEVKDTDLERLGDDAKETARKVDNAFDKIASSARTGTRKLDDETDDAKRSLRDVGEEAGDTAREVSASFSGSGSDILGGFQELAGQAGAALGPVGLAAGVAAAAGVGLITAEAEKLKEMTSDLVEDMLESGGKLTEAVIAARVQTMATDDPGNFTKYNDQAEALGLSIRDIARARAGDVDAIERVRGALGKLDAAQRENRDGAIAAQRGPIGPMQDLRQELNLTTEATKLAQEAVATASAATAESVATSTSAASASWDLLRGDMGTPIEGQVSLRAPSSGDYSAMRAAIQRGIGVIPVQFRKPGQNPFANTSSNTRYRD